MYGTFTLTGRHTTPSGVPHKGQVVITPNTVIRDTAGDVVMSGSVKVELDETGAWTVTLPCDDVTLNPSEGIGYRVGYSLRSTSMTQQSFYATANMAGTVLDVSDIVTVSVPTPLSTVTATTTWAGIADKPTITDLGGATAAQGAKADTAVQPAALTPLARKAGSNVGAPAPRVVVIGDSIENLFSYVNNTATTASESFGDRDWPTYAMLLSAGRFRLVRNAGVGGQNTTQYLARFDTDVVVNGVPNTIIIGGAENDIQQGIAIATTKANIIALVGKCYALGATPVLRTTMPHSLSNAVRQLIGAVNHWTRNYCAENGIPCLDFWAQVVDPATGQYQAAYTVDGVHPSIAGAKVLGQYAVDTLCAKMPPTMLSLAADPTDAGQIAPTPLFTTDTSGTPTLWNAIGGSPTGVTRSMVTDPLVPGRMARIANVASATSVSLQSSSARMNTTYASAGDILEVAGVLTSDGGVTATVLCSITYNDGTAKTLSRVPVSAVKNTLTRASYHVRMPALPVGFQYMQISLTTGAGTGVVDFGYPSVRNLTREGLL